MEDDEKSGEEEALGGIWFYGPYDRPQTAQLKLRNGAHRPVAFRLKCNRALYFHIKPSGVGVLQPNEAQLLTLTAVPHANDLEGHCFLMLEVVTVASPDQDKQRKDGVKLPRLPIDPIAAWNHINIGNLKKTAIPIYFGADAVGDDEEEIVVVLINETMMQAPKTGKRIFQRVRRRYPDAWWFFTVSLITIAAIAFSCGILVGMYVKRNRRLEEEAEYTD